MNNVTNVNVLEQRRFDRRFCGALGNLSAVCAVDAVSAERSISLKKSILTDSETSCSDAVDNHQVVGDFVFYFIRYLIAAP